MRTKKKLKYNYVFHFLNVTPLSYSKAKIMQFINQGDPLTVFCKILFRRSKYCLEFSIT